MRLLPLFYLDGKVDGRDGRGLLAVIVRFSAKLNEDAQVFVLVDNRVGIGGEVFYTEFPYN